MADRTPPCTITAAECDHQRLLCERDRLEQAQSEERRLNTIEATLKRIETKLDEVVMLSPRVDALEDWKLRLNGKAEALVEFNHLHPKPIEIRTLEPPHRIDESGNHIEERTPAELQVRMTWKTLRILLTAIAVSLFILIGLALVAGERGWVVISRAKSVVEQHAEVQKDVHDTITDVKKSVDYLRHMHEFHGGPDPDRVGAQ